MRQKELTVTIYVGGKQVESLTEEQKDKIVQSLSETMSRYYTAHLDEYEALLRKRNLWRNTNEKSKENHQGV